MNRLVKIFKAENTVAKKKAEGKIIVELRSVRKMVEKTNPVWHEEYNAIVEGHKIIGQVEGKDTFFTEVFQDNKLDEAINQIEDKIKGELERLVKVDIDRLVEDLKVKGYDYE